MTDQVRFLAYHRPALLDGEYSITVEQKTAAAGRKDAFVLDKTFAIEGERFSLGPDQIHAVFPPPDSVGDHGNVLPHVVLSRSTLPWERSACVSSGDTPWLAVLLFGEGEVTETTTTLEKIGTGNASFPGTVPADERGAVTVIDVTRDLLEKLLPTRDEVGLLTHVREVDDFVISDQALKAARRTLAAEDIANLKQLVGIEVLGEENFKAALKRLDSVSAATIDAIINEGLFRRQVELAVVVSNRLPNPNGFNTAHLVSLEDRYQDDGQFDYAGGATTHEKIRLVSLRSWRFRCDAPEQSIPELLKKASCGMLRLARSDDKEIERAYSRGCVALRHRLRQGSKTVSWYQGPLTPARNPATLPGLAKSADELVRYQPTTGMFDISYAAAWELGRLLALQSKSFSVGLYHWKRAHAEQHVHATAPSHLPLAAIWQRPAQPGAPPTELVEWFRGISLLKGIPFSYLVPDQRLLPAESLRFFWLDSLWIEHLLDGAISIGRALKVEHERDAEHRRSGPFKTAYEQVTGVLVRSQVISSWPSLQLDGYGRHWASQDQRLLDRVRCERLAPDVLIALFAGEITRLEIHPKPETLHFGVDRAVAGRYSKALRPSGTLVAIPCRPPEAAPHVERVVDVTALGKNINTALDKPLFSGADLALQMIEGVEKVVVEVHPRASA